MSGPYYSSQRNNNPYPQGRNNAGLGQSYNTMPQNVHGFGGNANPSPAPNQANITVPDRLGRGGDVNQVT